MSSSVISANGDSKLPPEDFSASTFLHDAVEYAVELHRGLLDTQPNQAERGALVENHHENDTQPNDGNMDIVSLTFVKEHREFLFTDELGESICCRNIAGSERCQ